MAMANNHVLEHVNSGMCHRLNISFFKITEVCSIDLLLFTRLLRRVFTSSCLVEQAQETIEYDGDEKIGTHYRLVGHCFVSSWMLSSLMLHLRDQVMVEKNDSTRGAGHIMWFLGYLFAPKELTVS